MKPPNFSPRPSSPPPGGLDPADWALFLDIDGTLVDLIDDPKAVRADAALLDLLTRLDRLLDGALAIVSGRDLADIDRILAPLRLPAAGGHGAALRRHAGAAASAVAKLDAAKPHPAARDGVRVERKTHSTAFHYRGRPDAKTAAQAMAERLLAELGDGWRLLPGKDVFEVLPATADKGRAVARFMETPPFAGRRPIFIGDDVTDEGGFNEVNGRGGLSIRIGPPSTTSPAAARLDSPAALRRWLADAWAAPAFHHNQTIGGDDEHP